ncbi:hypothetical protein [Variovorax atrisoli]|uniref:hypothetical protein n=1 Tax=Variovorax atrisoli TaxID=3394203 RepID=UPI00037D14CF|nr:hypothetical protein [Variovorax paradoxus]
MIDCTHDLATVFFGDDFAVPFTRRRRAAADVTVMVIIGTVDSDALDARARAATRTARFAAGQDVRADDELIAGAAVGPEVPAGTVFKLLDHPQRVNDGLEMEVLLGSVTP